MRFSVLSPAMLEVNRWILILGLAALVGACGANNDGEPSPSTNDPTSGVAGAPEPGAGGGAAGSRAGGAGRGTGGAGRGAAGSGDPGGSPGAGGVDGGHSGGAAGAGPAGGSGTPGGAAGGGVGGSGGVGGATTVRCGNIVEGISSLTVDGGNRRLKVQLPASTSGPMAVLFLWHGWNQDERWSDEVVWDLPRGQWLPFDPNAFPMPLMIVSPLDRNLLPPLGLDWNISNGEGDVEFFDAIMQCIQQQFTIDRDRIYSFGFSAGAVMTNLLSAHYPHLFAATISESGAWFNDRAEWSDIIVGASGTLFPLVMWDWPAFEPEDGGNVLLTHGGQMDFATIISLESANAKALGFLHANGRKVTECSHDFGHTLAPDLTQRNLYDWMWAHRRGGAPVPGLLPGFPSDGAPVGSTTCRFHP